MKKIYNKCHICGDEDKSPLSKYCKLCRTMLDEESRKLLKEVWSTAAKIVKKKRKLQGS